ncbi:MAG TPA: hypothetical protein VLD37_01080 [Candidatus Bilamarchaeum sp.]|nr:hypothetical protein [Candidatus Bilamarchaeum sp.]
MANNSDFTNGQETEHSVALPYDYFEHVVQQNRRDEESRIIHKTPRERLRPVSYSETCERCGRELRHVYVLNGKRLCKKCMESAQDSWVLITGSPTAAPQRVSLEPVKAERRASRMDSLISEFLALFHLKWIEEEILTEPKLPEGLARVLALKRPDKKQMPKTEGIMDRKR